MPPIELGPLGPQAARAVRAVDAKTVSDKPVQGTPVANDTARAHASEHSAVVRSAALDAGPAPVDGDRVAVIRKAIEQGHYPVLPTKVADAMIAAGFLLRSGK
ncbi:MAG: flagellar biosynthesis anti-sigma factor FlgM [Novosphingobium sp.]